MSFGVTPLSTTILGTDQFPVSAVAVPDTPGGDLTALEGGPISTDGNGNKTAPASVYLKDGSSVTLGLSTDANTVHSVMGRLTKIRDLLLSTLTVTGSVTTSGTVTANIGTTNGVALDTSVNGILLSQGSTTSGEKGPLIQGAVTSSTPSYTTAQTSPLSLTLAGALRVDNSANTQPISGTITANQGGTWNITNVSGTITLPTGAATSAKQPAFGTAGTASADVLTVQGSASMTVLKVDGSAATQPVSGTFWQATQPISGTVTANAGSGTFSNQQSNITTDYDTGAGTQTMTMFGMALPASGGAVSGGTSSNPLRTDPTGTTPQPVSGTVSITANSAINVAQVAGTTTDTNSGNKSAGTQRIVLATDQPQLTNALKVDGSAVTQPVSGTFWQATQPVSGTVTANAGTGPFPTAGMVASGSANANNPVKVGGVFNTTQPTVTNGQVVDGQYSARGAALVATGVDTFNVTVNAALPTGSNVIGHVVADNGSTTAVTQATASNLNAQVVGSVASAGSNAGNPVKVGGVFNTTQPTVTNGQVVDAQMTARGAQIVATGTDTFNATINAALPTGSNVIGSTTIQATSGTALVADVSNSELRVSNYGKSSAAGDTPILVDSTGRVLMGRSTTALFTTTQTAQGTGNSGDLTVGAYSEISIDLNLTADAGTNPTIQFTWTRKGADGLYYPIWESELIQGLPANPTKISASIGSGMEWAQSLGPTGRLEWTVGGTATPTYTWTPNVYAR